jgi:hypothetical protein
MKRVVSVACLALALAAWGASLSAQWPAYPTPNVPKTKAGEPDIDGPTPRTADGKPDFSGVWRGIAGEPGPMTLPVSGPPLAVYREVGQNLKEGLPVTAYGLEILKQRIARSSRDNPSARCLPMGILQLHTQGDPRKFVQTPRVLVILYEAGAEVRQIFTDGRPSPGNDPQPWWNGYSVGRWEQDDLVVQTTNFRDGGWLDLIGSPLTDAGKVTERFRRPSFGRMEIDVTIEDAKAYTKPFTVRINQILMLNEELIEYVCLENQRFTP